MPSAWTVAAALKLQGHKDPEKEAARIMRESAKSAEERAFWRKLGTAAILALATVLPYRSQASTHTDATLTEPSYMHYAKSVVARLLRFIRTFVTDEHYGTPAVLA